MNWTTKEIPDLNGKIIVVTGGNSGLGYQSVKAFAEKGATVILACRSISKGNAALIELRKTYPNAKVQVEQLDLTDMFSIRDFALNFKKNYQTLDVLLNNAGIMMVPYQQTKDGFESQLGTNHLGHFALTGLLLDILKKTPSSRVVSVSSIAHKQGKIDFDNLNFEKGKGYNSMKAYGNSKLSNLLFAFELQRFFEKNKIDCISVAAHPGVSDTNLFSHMASKWMLKILRPLMSMFVQPASMGALPQLRASVEKDIKGGEFYGPNGTREMKGYPVIVDSNAASKDIFSAKKLWEASEGLTGVKFN